MRSAGGGNVRQLVAATLMGLIVSIGAASEQSAPSTPASTQNGQKTVQERVDVPRVLVDLRVIDDSGEPVTGLTKADFAVAIDGKPAAVDTADWVAQEGNDFAETHAAAAKSPPRSPSAQPAPRGRWIVLLYQKHADCRTPRE